MARDVFAFRESQAPASTDPSLVLTDWIRSKVDDGSAVDGLDLAYNLADALDRYRWNSDCALLLEVRPHPRAACARRCDPPPPPMSDHSRAHPLGRLAGDRDDRGRAAGRHGAGRQARPRETVGQGAQGYALLFVWAVADRRGGEHVRRRLPGAMRARLPEQVGGGAGHVREGAAEERRGRLPRRLPERAESGGPPHRRRSPCCWAPTRSPAPLYSSWR